MRLSMLLVVLGLVACNQGGPADSAKGKSAVSAKKAAPKAVEKKAEPAEKKAEPAEAAPVEKAAEAAPAEAAPAEEKKPEARQLMPWEEKGPPVAAVDRGQGVRGLLESCKMHTEGGNMKWAEGACHAAVKKASAKEGSKVLPRALYALGRIYERGKRLGEAIQAYREVIRLNPDHGSAKKRLAKLEKSVE